MNSKYIQIITLALVFGLQFLFEHIYPQRKEYNSWKNERFNIGIGLLNVLLTLAPAALLVQWIELIELKQIGLLNQVQLSIFPEVLLTIFLLDAWLYAWHFLNHKLPFLWRFHSFHHKDLKMNTTTALRFHIVEILLSYPGKAMVIFVLGISYWPLLIYELLFFASVVIHHSNIFITERVDNIYRKLFASPLMHRIHHSKKRNETNSNFGGLFSFWDVLFNTRIRKAEGDIVFGIEDETNNKVS